jgi:hypothetical protein
MGDDELDVLLAHGRLSAPDRDRMFDRIMATQPKRRWRGFAVAVGSLLAAAAMVLMIFTRSSSFRARGASGNVLEIACRAVPGQKCPQGEVLLFRVSGVAQKAWLAAYAEPLGSGERVWYFPTAQGFAPSIEAKAAPDVLPQGARLGPEQPPGRYQVKLLLFSTPPTRNLDGTPLAVETRPLEVTP